MDIHISLSAYSRVVFIFPNPKCKHNQVTFVEKWVILCLAMHLLASDHIERVDIYVYIYVCWNGWIKHNKPQINTTFLLFRLIWKDVSKDLKDVNWLKQKMWKDVTEIDSMGVKFDY